MLCVHFDENEFFYRRIITTKKKLRGFQIPPDRSPRDFTRLFPTSGSEINSAPWCEILISGLIPKGETMTAHHSTDDKGRVRVSLAPSNPHSISIFRSLSLSLFPSLFVDGIDDSLVFILFARTECQKPTHAVSVIRKKVLFAHASG